MIRKEVSSHGIVSRRKKKDTKGVTVFLNVKNSIVKTYA